MLGSILTQHTTWTNVELALSNVLSVWGPQGLSDPAMWLDADANMLAGLLRPAGFYTAKPRKVLNLAEFVVREGGVSRIIDAEEPTAELRAKLLGIWGIGPETADAILLYAFGRPVFIGDAYAQRLAARWGLLPMGSSYESIQGLFMDNLAHDTALFDEYHALIVAHAKDLCRPRPRCAQCPLSKPLPLQGPESDQTESEWCCPQLYTPQRGTKQ